MRPSEVVSIELIGMHISVPHAANPSLKGMEGRIVDETKHTFVIEGSDGRERRVLKKQVTISFIFKGKRYELDGSHFTGRPEERLKKRIKQSYGIKENNS